MMQINQQEGKALPDWYYVKQELLQSAFNADILMASYYTDKRRNAGDLKEATKWILDLFLKLETKIDLTKPDYKDLTKIKAFIDDGAILKDKDWRNGLKSLNKQLDDMGVTRIEMPIPKQIQHPFRRRA